MITDCTGENGKENILEISRKFSTSGIFLFTLFFSFRSLALAFHICDFMNENVLQSLYIARERVLSQFETFLVQNRYIFVYIRKFNEKIIFFIICLSSYA